MQKFIISVELAIFHLLIVCLKVIICMRDSHLAMNEVVGDGSKNYIEGSSTLIVFY